MAFPGIVSKIKENSKELLDYFTTREKNECFQTNRRSLTSSSYPAAVVENVENEVVRRERCSS